MNIEEFREYCLSKPHTTEGFPFDETTLVFKVAGKMFALTNIDLFESTNLKCDPEKAEALREQYPDYIFPGYHMNKKHWNTVSVELEDKLLVELINHSYELVYKSLPKKTRLELEG